MRTTLALTATALLVLTGCGGTTDDADGDTSGSDDLMLQAEDIQAQLDPFFEGCEWEVSVDEDDSARTSCAEHELGVIVESGPNSVRGVLEGMGEATPVGGYVTAENWAVWSTDEGNVNMAWDVLGASGERGSFSS